MNRRLQDFLDGRLADADRRAFLEELDRDPALRAEHDLHVDIAASLRRRFTVPDIELPVARRRWWPWVVAATAVAAALLVWLWPRAAEPAPQARDTARAVGDDWAAVYATTTQRLEQPIVACTAVTELPDFFAPMSLPSPLSWQQQPGVVFRAGLETRPLEPFRVLHLVADNVVDLLVFIVPAAADPKPKLPEDSPLRLHRRKRGLLILYELSPLPAPRALGCLVASQPNSWFRTEKN